MNAGTHTDRLTRLLSNGEGRTIPGSRLSTFFTSGRGRSMLALCLGVKIIGAATGTAEASTGAATHMSCAVKDVDASLVSHPVPETPAIARQAAALGDVTIFIALSPRGELERATVFKSSGSSLLDREALRVVRASTFAPGRASCAPISSESLYIVSFNDEE